MENKGTKYYYCTNCGTHGDLGKHYKINKNCEHCDYSAITPFTEEEIKEDKDLWMDRFKKKLS